MTASTTTIALVHGIGGAAATMRPLAELLTARGHDVRSVTLPGHGTVPEDLVGVTWGDWLAAVPAADVLVGQSMGATLALASAIGGAARLVVAVNPLVGDEDVVDGLEWRQSRGHEWLDTPEVAPGDESYTRLPITALIEMVRGALTTDLTAVTVPVLLAVGALDESTDPLTMDALAAQIGGAVTRLMLPNSGHVATLGPDLALLVDALERLLQQ
jgi:carboxylesterase